MRAIVNTPSAVAGTGILLFVFTALADSRLTQASPEGDLEWVSPARFAGLRMVEDVPVLLDRILSSAPDEEPFFARYRYSESDELEIIFAK